MHVLAALCRSAARGRRGSCLSRVSLTSGPFPSSVSMSEKALAQGSTEPPVQPGKLRLYSMRFCPFAERARLILVAKNVPHDIVNIHLKNKPDWFLKKFPLGKVPTLVLGDGRALYESLIICDYLEEVHPSPALYNKCPYQRAWNRIQIEMVGRILPSLVKVMTDPAGVDEHVKGIRDGLQWFEDELVRIKTPFFRGESVGMVDYMVWPFMNRFKAIPHMTSLNSESSSVNELLAPFPKLKDWISRMEVDPVCQVCDVPVDLMAKYLSSYATGQPDFDAGLGA